MLRAEEFRLPFSGIPETSAKRPRSPSRSSRCLLVWIFVLRDRHAHRQVVPAVVGLPQHQSISRLTQYTQIAIVVGS